MDIWTILYNMDGKHCVFQMNGSDLKENTYEEVVRIFKDEKKKEIEDGRITTFNVTYTHYYETVTL